MLLTSTTTCFRFSFWAYPPSFFCPYPGLFFTPNNQTAISLPVCFIPVSLPVHTPDLRNTVFQPNTIPSPDSFPFVSLPTDHQPELPDIQDSQGRKWKVMRDSSIHPIRKVGTESMDEYRVEFVTPVLKYEDLDTLQAIIRKFREIGGVPHSSCGIHIHVDGANHTATSLRRLVNFMYSRQEIIYDALAVGDRKYRWCQPVCKNLLDTMKKDKNITTDSVEKIWYSPANDGYCGGINHQHYNSTRYHALNLHSFFQKGTVEFRLFNSTLHAGKIKAFLFLLLKTRG